MRNIIFTLIKIFECYANDSSLIYRRDNFLTKQDSAKQTPATQAFTWLVSLIS